MVFQIRVAITGDTIVIDAEPGAYRRELANVMVTEPMPPVGKGRLIAVGERIVDLDPRDRQLPGNTEIVPFGDASLSANYAVAFLDYGSHSARTAVWPGWRNVFRGGMPVVTLDYPAWATVPAAERTAFVRAARRGLAYRSLAVNGTTYLEWTALRRMLGLGPRTLAEP